MDDTEPVDPLSDLAKGAAAQHEIFLTYVAAGFTRAESLQIIIAMLTANIGSS